MPVSAVIFDLFGTLIPNLALDEHQAVLAEMAGVLGAPAADFIRGWLGSGSLRITGAFGDPTENAAHVCRALGVQATQPALHEAARIRTAYTRRSLVARPGAVETLAAVRATGCRVGVLTDCSSEVPRLWPETPFAALVDAVAFSCQERARKPEPRLYLTLCARLGVQPGACVYVGDGGGHELSGAAALGMRAVLLPDRDPRAHQFDLEAEWAGEQIEGLADVVRLLD